MAEFIALRIADLDLFENRTWKLKVLKKHEVYFWTKIVHSIAKRYL